jgi:hypothetical protein
MKALGVVNCLLVQSVYIEVGTKILHLNLEGMLEAMASALESHILKKVGHTI